MRLSKLQTIVPVSVIKDGAFVSLGYVIHSYKDMLVFLESDHYLNDLLSNKKVSCVLTTKTLADRLPSHLGIAASDNPRKDFFQLHNHLAKDTNFYWENFPTEIAEDAVISPAAYIDGANVRIGHGTVIEPHVTILSHSIIGDDVILRAGCLIGTQGFEFKRFGEVILSVAHAGGVLIHDRVELQGNTVVDRAVFGGFTEIEEDVKTDNLVHVAHNVRIGKRSRIAASAMIAGSVTIGKDVWIGPSAVISDGITIGDGAFVTLGSVVTRDVKAGQRVTGNFAIEHEKFISFIKKLDNF
jgi:UDP-3-O-[3-hydroxymyristoyl] glucosamine N-acyltransferase